MAFDLVAVKQYKTFTVTGNGSTLAVQPDSNVTAGNMLIVLAGTTQSGTGECATLTGVADTSTNGWGSITNVRSAGDFVPNCYAAVAHNIAGGVRPTVTLTHNLTSGLAISGVLIEVEEVPTSSAVDKTVTGTGTGGSSTSTSATGTLSQTDNLVLVACAGWFGDPANPSGYTEIMSIANGASPGYVGFQASWQKVTATSTLTPTVSHPDAATANTSAIALVIKASSAGSTRIKFELDPSTLTSADTGITAYVWRNTAPDGGAATKIESLSGSATAGVVYATTGLPSGSTPGDTIVAILFNGTDTSGLISGTVETY